MNRSVPLALTYIFGSIILGPAIALAGYVITPANGDFCDVGAHGSREQRDRDYALIDTIWAVGASLGLTVGVLLLGYLWFMRRRVGWLRVGLLSGGILIMMSGYGVILGAASYGNAGCS